MTISKEVLDKRLAGLKQEVLACGFDRRPKSWILSYIPRENIIGMQNNPRRFGK